MYVTLYGRRNGKRLANVAYCVNIIYIYILNIVQGLVRNYLFGVDTPAGTYCLAMGLGLKDTRYFSKLYTLTY